MVKSRSLKVKIVFSKSEKETSGIFILKSTFEESEAPTSDIVKSDMLKPFSVKPLTFKVVLSPTMSLSSMSNSS